jgi:hypothetical protein
VVEHLPLDGVHGGVGGEDRRHEGRREQQRDEQPDATDDVRGAQLPVLVVVVHAASVGGPGRTSTW